MPADGTGTGLLKVGAMELLLTGTPGPLLGLVERLIAAVAVATNTAVTVRRHDPMAADDCTAAAVCSGALRSVIAIDDPARCLAVMAGAGFTAAEAARRLTAIAAPLVDWVGRNAPRVLPAMSVGEAMAAIIVAIGLPADAASDLRLPGWDNSAILAELAIDVDEFVPGPIGAMTEIRTLSDEVVGPLFAAAASGVRQTVTWSRDCLFWGDHPGEKLPRIIDLTGPARVLVYGPYFHLPVGDWTLQATLAFSPEAVGAPFAIELHSDVLLGRGRFRPTAAAVFAVSCHVVVQTAKLPNEIRVVNENGAIEGDIGIDHVLLIPRP